MTIGLDDLWPDLAEVVVEQMGDVYPELVENRSTIQEIVRRRGGALLGDARARHEAVRGAAPSGAISGEDAFMLHDTYGFPLELTRELALGARDARRRGRRSTSLMSEQRARSRAGAKQDDAKAAEFGTGAGFETEFVGYEKTEVLTQIGALEPLEDGGFLAKLRESPFYPEGGGQVSDAGFIEHDETGARAELEEAYPDRRRPGARLPRRGLRGRRSRARRRPLERAVPDDGEPHRDPPPPQGTPARCSATTSARPGSAVRPDKLRFDFTHGQALTPEERSEVERRVNEKVFENHPVHAFVTPIEEARKLGRDDALRREIRRRGARGRGPGLLARALRRDPRPLDRRDRPVRDHVAKARRLRRRGGSRP